MARQHSEVHCISPFPRFQLIHVLVLMEKCVPVMSGWIDKLGFTCPHLERVCKAIELQGAAVKSVQNCPDL